MSTKIEKILDEIESSYESAAAAVADHLRTVAENGREYSTKSHLVSEAENLVNWAQEFIKRVNTPCESESTTT